MLEFFEKLKTIHKPSEAEPWFELEYTDFSDFRRFLQFINEIDNCAQLREQYQPFFFRGQAETRWSLKPKLVRLLEGMPADKALTYEFDSICYFRERAHLFRVPLIPKHDDLLEWLCLMQHYSAPTRMLDWTSSFTVALYFAVCDEPADSPGAVWLVQAKPLWNWMNRTFPESELDNEDMRQKIFSSSKGFVDFGMNRAQARLHGYDPDRKFERVTVQRGVFTICEKLFVDHAALIGEALVDGSVAGENWPLCKIVISSEAKRFFRQYLSKLNITAATLFPGTDGLGRTISETIRVHRETFWAKYAAGKQPPAQDAED